LAPYVIVDVGLEGILFYARLLLMLAFVEVVLVDDDVQSSRVLFIIRNLQIEIGFSFYKKNLLKSYRKTLKLEN
jgi:hypothetical protein